MPPTPASTISFHKRLAVIPASLMSQEAQLLMVCLLFHDCYQRRTVCRYSPNFMPILMNMQDFFPACVAFLSPRYISLSPDEDKMSIQVIFTLSFSIMILRSSCHSYDHDTNLTFQLWWLYDHYEAKQSICTGCVSSMHTASPSILESKSNAWNLIQELICSPCCCSIKWITNIPIDTPTKAKRTIKTHH